jgi:hypothetical protein
VLDRVDHLAVTPDDQAKVVALELGPDLVGILFDVHGRLDANGVENPLEQFMHA